MTLRMPQSLSGGLRPEAGLNVLQHEIAQQKADTLGEMGRQVERALARLRDIQADPARNSGPGIAAALDEAADRVWALMVQRELCGLRHWEAVVKAYGIPREVLNRMGRVSRPAAPVQEG